MSAATLVQRAARTDRLIRHLIALDADPHRRDPVMRRLEAKLGADFAERLVSALSRR
jgi:hypothetical protein